MPSTSQDREPINPYAAPAEPAVPVFAHVRRPSWKTRVGVTLTVLCLLAVIQIISGWLVCLLMAVVLLGSAAILLATRQDVAVMVAFLAIAAVSVVALAFEVGLVYGVVAVMILGLTAAGMARWLHAGRHIRRANQLYSAGAAEEAIAEWDHAIAANPRDSGAYCNRGTAHVQCGRLDLALDDYNTAIRIEGDVSAYYLNRGCLLERLGRYKEARDDFERARKLDPSCASAAVRAAQLPLKSDQLETRDRQ